METKNDGKVGLGGLIALIVGSSIGSGIFALPATVTGGANPAGILIGWAIVGIGMLSLVSVYSNLTLQQSNIDDGIYGWSRNAFGHLGGFIGAFGHGAGDAIGNASYLVVLFSALGSFGIFDYFGKGTTWPAIICASAVLWIVNYFVLRGVKSSTRLNNFTTIIKIIPIVLFIVLAIIQFNPHIFMHSFASTQVMSVATGKWTHVSLFNQSKTVLLATMWTLIGLESGTIFATRARKLADVAKATIIGALIVVFLLVGTTVLALGLMAPSKISQLHDPSMAGLMTHMVGSWGGTLIDICLILAVLGALIAWVNLSAEEVRLAGRGGSAAKWLNGLNQNEAPRNSLLITTGITQVLMIIAGIDKSSYVTLLSFSTSLALIPYLFSSIYALKSVIVGTGFANRSTQQRVYSGVTACIAILFVFFMIYGAGFRYLLLAAIVWSLGLPFFFKGKRERHSHFNKSEIVVCSVIFLMALVGIYALVTGSIQFDA
ncbi:amino acid permease [Secundilactobacillus malefermentans]|uniref:amino acid permease n=1 Tax=Secundilactobacillus malefermentans TaxID=176292 RepID=UPI0011C7B171|nr:amino acid permease [Secundilactobacillus malefermentans]QEA31483.1 amino acid permease [Secundilactobacillus malefermentans]